MASKLTGNGPLVRRNQTASKRVIENTLTIDVDGAVPAAPDQISSRPRLSARTVM